MKEDELLIEEVNIYTSSCNEIRSDCLTDCIDGSAWLSTLE